MSWTAPGDPERLDATMKQLPISRINALLSSPSNFLIRLYSFQSAKTCDDAFRNKGYLTGRNHFEDEDNSLTGNRAYAYLVNEMHKSVPNFSGDYPVFAWPKRPSGRNRPYYRHGSGGDVLITFVVPRERIIVSNYDRFCCALFENPIYNSSDEEDERNHRFPGHWSYMDEKTQSAYFDYVSSTWDRMFAFDVSTDPDKIEFGSSKKYFRTQICVDRIYPEEIVSIKRANSRQVKKDRWS